jgi:hypothetical protein
MAEYNVRKAKSHFSELVKKAMLGKEVVPRGTRKPGSGQGEILYMAKDFDATPAVFEPYLK